MNPFEISNHEKQKEKHAAIQFFRSLLELNVVKTVDFYNAQLAGWISKTAGKGPIEQFLSQDNAMISWSEGLKNYFKRGVVAEYEPKKIRASLYRPFTKQFLYYDAHLNERRYQMPLVFPPEAPQSDNTVIWAKVGTEIPMFALATDAVPNLLAQGGSQCFPFYSYAKDGTSRRENITDWALEQFRSHYHDPSITKWDIFHYTYAALHHPEYRVRYAANLRRELPRIPFVNNDETPPSANSDTERTADDSLDRFQAFVHAGQRLTEIHVRYEHQAEYPLVKTEKPGEKLNYCVTRMKLSKDKTSIFYNQFLTLSGIPAETYDYRLGNRSALEWVIDQYQVSTDKRSGITNDPNRPDDPEYILRLIGQVITVSLETNQIVRSLPELGD